jgi:hypothetical protein
MTGNNFSEFSLVTQVAIFLPFSDILDYSCLLLQQDLITLINKYII